MAEINVIIQIKVTLKARSLSKHRKGLQLMRAFSTPSTFQVLDENHIEGKLDAHAKHYKAWNIYSRSKGKSRV